MRIPGAYIRILSCILLLLLCLSMGLIASSFLAEPEEAFGPHPLLTLDAGTHVEHHRITVAIEKSTGRPWGYNAGYVAGYGHTYELSVPILGTMLYRAVQDWMALATFRWLEYFLPILLLPPAVFWAARSYGLTRWRPLFAAFWASGYVWLGFPCLFILAGPVDKMLALVLSIGAGLLADSAWEKGCWKRGVGALLTAVFAGYLHRASILWFALMLTVSWLLHLPRRRGFRRMLLWPAVAVLLGLLASAPWLFPLLRFWGGMDPEVIRSLSFHSGRLLSILEPLIPSAPLDGHKQILWGSAFLQLTPWVLGMTASLLDFRRDRRSRLTLLTVTALLVCSILSLFIRGLQIFEPITFFVPATVLLIIRSAAVGTGNTGRFPVSTIVPGLVLLSVLAAWRGPSYQTLVRAYDLYPSTRIPQVLQDTTRMIRAHVNDDRRIVVEEGRNAVNTRDRFRLVYPMAVLGHATGKNFLGYPCPLQIRGSVASFNENTLLGLDIGSCGPETLRKRLEDYNVGWVVAFTPARAAILTSMPSVMRLVAEENDVWLFLVTGGDSYFYRGSGEVLFLPGIIQLQNLKPEDGVVILKAHFAPGLASTPPADIVPHPIRGDTAGFLEIRNPPKNLEIRMSLF